MPDPNRPPSARPDGTTYREIVGLFRDPGALERAISALAGAGWDRADMSLLAQHSVLKPDTVTMDTTALADDDTTEREAVISDTDIRQGRTLAAGIAGVTAAFVASGATIMTGGTALAAVVGAAVGGGGAAAAVDALGHRIDQHRARFLRQQVEQGGILLWARLRRPEQETVAGDILHRCGAVDIHVHEVANEEAVPVDPVEEASLGSFPTSDPPAWIGITVGGSARRVSAEDAAPVKRRARRTTRKR